MKNNILIKKQHMIDFLFPLALFFTFALCAMLVILFANSIYKEAVDSAATTNNAQTAMTYIAAKIHTGDQNGAVSIIKSTDQTTTDQTAAGQTAAADTADTLPAGITEALVISDNADDYVFNTYIYLNEGAVCELTAAAGSSVTATAGDQILKISSLTMEQLSEDLFRFTCTDEEGNSSSTIVAVRSNEEEIR